MNRAVGRGRGRGKYYGNGSVVAASVSYLPHFLASEFVIKQVVKYIIATLNLSRNSSAFYRASEIRPGKQ